MKKIQDPSLSKKDIMISQLASVVNTDNGFIYSLGFIDKDKIVIPGGGIYIYAKENQFEGSAFGEDGSFIGVVSTGNLNPFFPNDRVGSAYNRVEDRHFVADHDKYIRTGEDRTISGKEIYGISEYVNKCYLDSCRAIEEEKAQFTEMIERKRRVAARMRERCAEINRIESCRKPKALMDSDKYKIASEVIMEAIEMSKEYYNIRHPGDSEREIRERVAKDEEISEFLKENIAKSNMFEFKVRMEDIQRGIRASGEKDGNAEIYQAAFHLGFLVDSQWHPEAKKKREKYIPTLEEMEEKIARKSEIKAKNRKEIEATGPNRIVNYGSLNFCGDIGKKF